MATIEWLPTVLVATVQVVEPEARTLAVHPLIDTPPSVKATLPAAVLGLTVAV